MNTLRSMLETYGLRETLGQGYEKLVIDPIRYRKIKTSDSTMQRPISKQTKHLVIGGEPFPGTVCFFTHTYFPNSSGGTERFVYNQAQRILETGGRAFIFAYSVEPRSNYPHLIGGILYREDVYQGIPVIRFRLAKAFFGGTKSISLADMSTWEPFFGWMIHHCLPQIIHFAGLNRVNVMASLCQKYQMPYIVTATDFFPVCHYSTLIDKDGMICPGSVNGARCVTHCSCGRAGDLMERHKNAHRILAGAKAVCVPSDYVAHIFAHEFSGLLLTVIPHGLDRSRQISQQRQGSVRRYMYAGSISEAKGVFLLISAFSDMPRECTLSIFGSGNRFAVSRLKRQIRKNGRVTYYGLASAERLWSAYENSDCVVVPSLVPETYNFVAHEALQSGCVVVAGDIGVFPEMIRNGKNGFLYSGGKAVSVGAALKAAMRFSWEDYHQTHFLSIEEEVSCYHALYHKYAIARGKESVL